MVWSSLRIGVQYLLSSEENHNICNSNILIINNKIHNELLFEILIVNFKILLLNLKLN